MNQGLSLVTMLALSAASAVTAQNIDAEFMNYPSYNGDDLELTVDNSGTHWRLWSPAAEGARVILYPTDRNTAAIDTIAMTKSEKGTWVANVPEKLYGTFYTFSVLDKANGLQRLLESGQRLSVRTDNARP